MFVFKGDDQEVNNQTTISLDSVRVNLVFVWSRDDVCQVDVNKMAGGRKRVRPWDLNKRLVLGSVALPPGCSLTHTLQGLQAAAGSVVR